jgi:hypothetical protein
MELDEFPRQWQAQASPLSFGRRLPNLAELLEDVG